MPMKPMPTKPIRVIVSNPFCCEFRGLHGVLIPRFVVLSCAVGHSGATELRYALILWRGKTGSENSPHSAERDLLKPCERRTRSAETVRQDARITLVCVQCANATHKPAGATRERNMAGVRLKSVQYSERLGTPKEWTLEPLTLGAINLIVGKNATGKTR